MSSPMWDIPEHCPIDVNANGDGPAERHEAARTVCWCPDGPRCAVIPPTHAYGWAGAAVGSPPMTDTTEDTAPIEYAEGDRPEDWDADLDAEEVEGTDEREPIPLTDHDLNRYVEALAVTVIRVDDDGPVHNGITLAEILEGVTHGPYSPTDLIAVLIAEVKRLRDGLDLVTDKAYPDDPDPEWRHRKAGRGPIAVGAQVRIADGQDPTRVYESKFAVVRLHGLPFVQLPELENALVETSRLIVVG